MKSEELAIILEDYKQRMENGEVENVAEYLENHYQEPETLKTFEVIIDLGSRTFLIDAMNKDEAESKALEKFKGLAEEDKIVEFWVGECNLFEEE